jgi:hypothetical protein
MRMHKQFKPATGWQLYVIVLLMIGLLLLAHYLAPSSGWDKFLDITILVGGYGLLDWWTRSGGI